jgi:hypothetical protein
MHSKLLLAAVVIAVLGGCTASAVNPDAGISVSGRALDGAGNPIAQANVSLIGSSVSAINNSCGVAFADSTRSAATDTTGTYRFSLKGADTQLDGNARCFEASLSGDGGRQTLADFPIQVDAVTVPDLQLWDAQLVAQPGAAQEQFSWRAPTAALTGETALSTQVLNLTATDGVAWTTTLDKAAGSAVLPDAVLEDFALTAQLTAIGVPKGSGVIFSVAHRSSALPLLRGTALPLSRGAPCTSPESALSSPCPYTDGQLAAVPASVGQLTVTLAAPAIARHLLLRSVTGGRDVMVESSADGQTFTSVGNGLTGDGFIDVALTLPAPAATYRITFRTPGKAVTNPANLAELSLFP